MVAFISVVVAMVLWLPSTALILLEFSVFWTDSNRSDSFRVQRFLGNAKFSRRFHVACCKNRFLDSFGFARDLAIPGRKSTRSDSLISNFGFRIVSRLS